MADYLQDYAAHFDLPVRNEIKVDRLWREDDNFRLSAGDRQFEARNVVVAMAKFQQPRTPAFATRLASGITQLHSCEYRNPSQLQPGGVLIVGAGNSGAEIAAEVVHTHPTWLSGRPPGVMPFRVEDPGISWLLSRLVIGVVFQHVLTVETPIGRRARGKGLQSATPLIRVKPRDLVGVRDGLPKLEDDSTLPVNNVIWCTGFQPGFDWIDLFVFGEHEPLHERGIVPSQPGLYFVGLHFEYALSSSMVQGVSRDAKRVVNAIASRVPAHEASVTASGYSAVSAI
jgi:putative flavoprotein involved in K+ transport